MKIYAHRGASHSAPENSLTAFRVAWQAGADGAELDVHLSRDGRVIVCHDADTKRTADHSRVIAMTDSAELRKLDIGARQLFRFEPLPFLEEVVAEIPAGRELLVEIKCGPEIIPALLALNLPAESVGFLCFDPVILAATKRALPSHRCLLNVEPPGQLGHHDYAKLTALCRSENFAGISLGWHRGFAAEHVRILHEAGLAVAVWTVDNTSVAITARTFGVDVLMTNEPQEIMKHLRVHRVTDEV